MVKRHCSFEVFDELVVSHVASFLNLHSTYQWVCACQGVTSAMEVLSPEWFFRCTMEKPDEFELLPLDEESKEMFYLAETMNQMRKCRFIPKYYYEHSSQGINHLAKWLCVDPTCVYIERIAMFMGRLLHNATTHTTYRQVMDSVFLHDLLAAVQAYGFRNLPQHDRIVSFVDLSGFQYFLTIQELPNHQIEEGAAAYRIACDETFKLLLLEDSEPDAQAWEIEELKEPILQRAVQELYSTIGDNDDDVDMEGWLQDLQPSWKWDHQFENDCFEKYGLSPDEYVGAELESNRDDLEAVRSSLEGLNSMEAFGIYPSTSRLPDTHLRRYLKGQDLQFSDSAIKFLQLITEEVHFGCVVEAKLKRKLGPVDVTWDYGVLFGRNGTFLRSARLSDDNDFAKSDSDCDDDDFLEREEEEMDFMA